jgi:hypothetical protein
MELTTVTTAEKARIKDMVEASSYLSDDKIMDIADEIVPDYGQALVDDDTAKANRAYRKWLQVYSLTSDYVQYLEQVQNRQLPTNPLI